MKTLFYLFPRWTFLCQAYVVRDMLGYLWKCLEIYKFHKYTFGQKTATGHPTIGETKKYSPFDTRLLLGKL